MRIERGPKGQGMGCSARASKMIWLLANTVAYLSIGSVGCLPEQISEQQNSGNCFAEEGNGSRLTEQEAEDLWAKCGEDAFPDQTQSERVSEKDVAEWDDGDENEPTHSEEVSSEDEDQSAAGLEADTTNNNGSARGCSLSFIVPATGYGGIPSGSLTVEWDNTAYQGQEVAISVIEDWVVVATSVVPNTGVHQLPLPGNLDLSLGHHLSIISTTNGRIDQRCWDYTPLTIVPNTPPTGGGSFFTRPCIKVQSLAHALNSPNSCLPGASSNCTLADAIVYANNDSLTPGRDRICLVAHLPSYSPGEYRIDQILGTWPDGLPAIASLIWIFGNEGILRVERSKVDARIFHVSDTGRLHLFNAVLAEGRVFHHGGAILNEGYVALRKVMLQNNGASKSGGAIFNSGSLKLTQATAEGNNASFGGAIWSEGPEIKIGHSSFHKNQASGIKLARGGAIYFADGNEIEVENTTFSGNTAVARGGALFFGSNILVGANVKLSHLTIATNALTCPNLFDCFPAGAGIATEGDPSVVHMVNSIVSLNEWQGTAMNLSGNCLASHGGNIVGMPLSSGSLCSVQGLDDYSGINFLGAYTSGGIPGDGHHPISALSNSNALNFGGTKACDSADQLGNPRIGFACDSGSVIAQ